ncbi:sulfatase [Actinoplanes sp. KI2]|uniref:sulfatase family protein n=1 Tax=Actinoplanes sp. KI2 TaxID=2983315 RepID=UPI0021D5B633|nr:sulfatase [Actinoplanes sp. KI2]MCU7728557.1 sulfatase [Actinoplanes sp. KI2]
MIRRTLTALLSLAMVGACGSTGARSTVDRPSAADRPNVVLVLTDDLSMNLLPYLPQVQALAREGTTFANYTVTDSLCCPSRSSLFTGELPHDTGIFTNGGSDGGFATFHRRGEESSTFATDLHAAGYRTAMLGKYLNGYLPKDGFVPPGWDEWDVAGNGYPEYDYNLLENGKVVHYGHQYLTDVLSAKATGFITASAKAGKPFLVEVATFAPHAPYTPDDQDRNAFPGRRAPRTAGYDTLPSAAPPWLAARAPLTAAEKQQIDVDFRKRAQAVQAVDRMIGSVRRTVEAAGVANRTMIVFTSDNGYHMGEHRLNPGKMTAYDTDVRVPLVVAGPGVRAGATVTAPAENIDLRPTVGELAGAATPPTDGRSLVPLLRGQAPAGWRTAALVEHHGPDNDPADPDHPAKNSGNPPTYAAIRTTQYTYVEYSDGSKEYYDHGHDPDQLHNTVASLTPAAAAALHDALSALVNCHRSC